MNKSFIEYLIESEDAHRYVFKVKVAGEIPKGCEGMMKTALQKFNVESIKKGKTSPIQETLRDFPTIKNQSVTVFEVAVTYPTNSAMVLSAIAEYTNVPASSIKVFTEAEEQEQELNAEHAELKKEAEALLSQDYTTENNQDTVGDARVSIFMKELAKARENNRMKQYTGVNDEILAKEAPKGDNK